MGLKPQNGTVKLWPLDKSNGNKLENKRKIG
jgi:hypothetical protein